MTNPARSRTMDVECRQETISRKMPQRRARLGTRKSTSYAYELLRRQARPPLSGPLRCDSSRWQTSRNGFSPKEGAKQIQAGRNCPRASTLVARKKRHRHRGLAERQCWLSTRGQVEDTAVGAELFSNGGGGFERGRERRYWQGWQHTFCSLSSRSG